MSVKSPNSCIFKHENAFENVVWKMSAILSWPQCVKLILNISTALCCVRVKDMITFPAKQLSENTCSWHIYTGVTLRYQFLLLFLSIVVFAMITLLSQMQHILWSMHTGNAMSCLVMYYIRRVCDLLGVNQGSRTQLVNKLPESTRKYLTSQNKIRTQSIKLCVSCATCFGMTPAMGLFYQHLVHIHM